MSMESPNRRCSGCGECKPLNDANFPRRGELDRRSEWKSRCRQCTREATFRPRSPRPTATDLASGQRVGKKPCGTCFDMPHRAEEHCPECGIPYEAEPALNLRDFLWRSYERG